MKDKTLLSSSMHTAAYPKTLMERDAAIALVHSFSHVSNSLPFSTLVLPYACEQSDLVVKRNASLSLYTLLINCTNHASFNDAHTLNAIINSLLVTPLCTDSLPHFRMSISCLHLLFSRADTRLVDSPNTLLQDFLINRNPDGVHCLFRLCAQLTRIDAQLQQHVFKLIMRLHQLDNSIIEFHRANISSFLISNGLLLNTRCGKVISRHSTSLLYQLLLYDSTYCSLTQIEKLIFGNAPYDMNTVALDIHAEKHILNSVLYLLTTSKPISSALVFLQYLLHCVKSERISDVQHFLLILKCIRACIGIDEQHAQLALDSGILGCMLYASHHKFWSRWLIRSLEAYPNMEAVVLDLNKVSFDAPLEPQSSKQLNVYLFPKYVDLISEAVEIICATVLANARLIPTVLSSGIIPLLLANPKAQQYAGDVHDYTVAAVMHIVSAFLLVALAHQDRIAITSRHIAQLQDLLLPLSEGGTFESPVASIDLDISSITKLLVAQGVVGILLENVQHLSLLDSCSSLRVLSSIAILFNHLTQGFLCDAVVVHIIDAAIRNKKLFSAGMCVVCMV